MEIQPESVDLWSSYRLDVQQDGGLGDESRFLCLLGGVSLQALLLDALCLLVFLVAAEQVQVVVVSIFHFHLFDWSRLDRYDLDKNKIICKTSQMKMCAEKILLTSIQRTGVYLSAWSRSSWSFFQNKHSGLQLLQSRSHLLHH